jgi:hypothetical protein
MPEAHCPVADDFHADVVVSWLIAETLLSWLLVLVSLLLGCIPQHSVFPGACLLYVLATLHSAWLIGVYPLGFLHCMLMETCVVKEVIIPQICETKKHLETYIQV